MIKTNIVQFIPLPEGYNIAIVGIIPDEETKTSGTILLKGNPINCTRQERFHISGGVVKTESWHFSVGFLAKYLIHAGSELENGDPCLSTVVTRGYEKFIKQ